MAQLFNFLKEPLISQEQTIELQNGLLNSFVRNPNTSTYDIQNEMENHQKSEKQRESQISQEVLQKHDLVNYKEINRRYIDPAQQFKYQPEKKEFYLQAMAVHEKPALKIIKTAVLKNNPNIFATISKTSDFFQKVDVKEFMSLYDYKKYTKIRLKNYISILRMLSIIDDGFYKEIKKKLYQIIQLVKYLNLPFDKMYQRLHGNKPIYNFEDEEQEEEAIKNFTVNAILSSRRKVAQSEQKTLEIEGDSQDSDYNHPGDDLQDSDEEFYKESKVTRANDPFTHELEKEELKWIKRAEWLETKLEEMKQNENATKFIPWLIVKLEQLADLDVPLNAKDLDRTSSQVFYLTKFLQEKFEKEASKVEVSHPDFMVQVDDQEQEYPRVKFDAKGTANESYPVVKSWPTVREKLCRRINKIESETDYILTVFQKRTFGSEKKYEKRINLKRKEITNIKRFEFDPSGEYMYFEFAIQQSQPHQSNVSQKNPSYALDEDFYSENDNQNKDELGFSLIFPVNAQYKDPLMIKPGSSYIGFNDKYFYALDKVKKTSQFAQIKEDEIISQESEEIKSYETDQEQQDQSSYYYRIFEYDLYSFDKIQYMDLKKIQYMQKTEKYFTFFRCQNGFTIVETVEENQKYKIAIYTQANKYIPFFLKPTYDRKPQAHVNEKGDQILVVYSKDDYTQISKFQVNERILDFFTPDKKIDLMAGSISLNNKKLKNLLIRQQTKKVPLKSFTLMKQGLRIEFNFHFVNKYASKTKNNGFGQVFIIKYLTNNQNFLGINNQMRPLTIHGIVYNNKLSLTVPAIYTNYTPKNFQITVHQIKSRSDQTTQFKFRGRIRYRIYAFNNQLLNLLREWTEGFHENGEIVNQIKIISSQNSLNIERWNDQKCLYRILVSHYHQNIGFNERNVTNHHESDFSMNYKSQGYWCFVTHTEKSFQIFTAQMNNQLHFNSLLQLEPIYFFEDLVKDNEIYSIQVDTLVKDKISVYVIYSNFTMRQFTATINRQNLIFDEHPRIYNINYIFKSKGNKSQITSLTQFKGDIFIANQMLYSQNGIIDLQAQHFQDKYQIGCLINFNAIKNLKQALKVTYSFNEAKLAVFQQNCNILREQDDSVIKDGETIILTPLINSRMVPLFSHRSFIHPVTPILDKERGLTIFFCLKLGTYCTNDRQENQHFFQRRKLYNKLIDINPGLIIKYFNGIEQEIPLKDFGEEFVEIIRFKQSYDGLNLMIMGAKKKKDAEHPYIFEAGIFLYRIELNRINLIHQVLFPEKDTNILTYDLKLKLKHFPLQISEEIEPEITESQVGEYEQDDVFLQDGYHENQAYEAHIDFSETDLTHFSKHNQLQEQEKVEVQKKLFFQNVDEQKVQEVMHIWKNNDSKFMQMQGRFPGFEIPYLQNKTEWQKDFIQQNYILRNQVRTYDNPNKLDKDQVALAKYRLALTFKNSLHLDQDDILEDYQQRFGLSTLQFNFEYEKHFLQVFNDDDIEKIIRIHSNMHVEINDQGHLFLINRCTNTLYFFYTFEGELKLIKLKFEYSFVAYGADSSVNYMVVWAKDRFRIFDIQGIYQSGKEVNSLNVIYDSKKQEKAPEKDEVENETYGYTILNCKLRDNILKLKIQDEYESVYFKIFDFVNNDQDYYFNLDRYLISGDKQYIWDMERNIVYDIQNGLTTLFIWPGDQINVHSYDHMDYFNISEDRSIMITQGYLQLAFNYLSMIIDEETNYQEQFSIKKTLFSFNEKHLIHQANILSYHFYKITDYKSLLERIFYEEENTIMKTETFGNSIKELEQEPIQKQNMIGTGMPRKQKKKTKRTLKQQQQIKNLSAMVAYFSKNYNINQNDLDSFARFLLSFYIRDRQSLSNGFLNIFQKLYSFNEKRIDLIEDMLHYVVEAKDILILNKAINSCFCDFLQTANASLSFQQYLKNIIVQSPMMEETQTYQMKNNETGLILDTYDSPIMDEKFHLKFKDTQTPKKNVEIHYVKLGDLIKDKGEIILDTLREQKFLNIMDIGFIKYIVLYQWQNVEVSLKQQLLYPFYGILFLFTFYAMTIDLNDCPVSKDHCRNFQAKSQYRVFIEMINLINVIALVPNLCYFLYIEFRQFRRTPNAYFSSFWNMLDLSCYLLCLVAIFFERAEISNKVCRPIASYCVIVLWIKMFYFLAMYETPSRFIRMIIEIINDMKNFLIVLMIGILGFTGAFYIIQQGEVDQEEVIAGNPFEAIMYTYMLALGDYSVDQFDDLQGIDYLLAWGLFIVGSLFLVILLLNLLIAIMGNTFSKVLESITNLSIREKVMLISDNEILFNRKEIFKNTQYLIVVQEKNFDSTQAQNWDDQLNALKREVLTNVTSLKTAIDQRLLDNHRDIKKNLYDTEIRTKKQILSQDSKFQTFQENYQQSMKKIDDAFTLQQDNHHRLIEMSKTQSYQIEHLKKNFDESQKKQRKFNKKISYLMRKLEKEDSEDQEQENDHQDKDNQ